MSHRNRRPLMQSTNKDDEQAKTEEKTLWEELVLVASDLAACNQLKANPVFIKMVAMLDALEEKCYMDLRAYISEGSTNATRGRLEAFGKFREIMQVINGK